MIEVGNWVSIRNRNATGFILEVTYNDAMVFVIQDGKIKGKQRFQHHQLIRSDDKLLPGELDDLKRLHINMALDTNDREWLKRLTEAEESK